MKIINCKNCGASDFEKVDWGVVKCKYCGTVYETGEKSIKLREWKDIRPRSMKEVCEDLDLDWGFVNNWLEREHQKCAEGSLGKLMSNETFGAVLYTLRNIIIIIFSIWILATL